MTNGTIAAAKPGWTYPLGPTEPMDGFYYQNRNAAGVVQTNDAANMNEQRNRNSHGNVVVTFPGDQFRLMAETPNVRQVEGLTVVAEFRGEDGQPARQHPRILDAWTEASSFEGCVIYQHGSLLVVVFLLERAITDRELAAAAQRGAETLLSRWLADHDFAPREFRPKRFSEGYVVTPSAFDDWRPRALSMIDGQRNFPGLRSRDYLYDARALIGAAEAKGD